MSGLTWYFLIGALLVVLQCALTWPVRAKAPAFFWTLGVACMLILWPLFLFSMIEEAAAHHYEVEPGDNNLVEELKNSVDITGKTSV